MVSGLILCSLTSQVSYRLFPFTKLITKTIHVLLHTTAIICVCVGFSAVYIGNNNKNKNGEHKYYANFCTIHSFLGLAAILLYAQNYILGFAHYLMPASVEMRKTYMPSHMFLGMFSLFCACFAALTGIMELFTEYGCPYVPSSPDYNPAASYHKLKTGCQALNGMGIMILLTAFFAAYALWDVNTPNSKKDTGEQATLLNEKDRLFV